ncbi:MAG: penicillin-binding protein 1C [Treponema sp.]|jgi:penicillin-binding protein 1C|nr:penicillin-binding protein 1C [Treponema sp.]
MRQTVRLKKQNFRGKCHVVHPAIRKARIIFAALFLILLSFLIYQAVFFDVFKGISFSRVYTDRSGALLNIFLTEDDKYRVRLRLGDFPPELIEAVLLQEDKYFYNHIGVNPAAVFRSAFETYIKKSRRMGASTITMQLARLRYGLYTRNIPGKIKQIFYAIFFEICLSKQEILEAYLNLAPCGGNIEGYGAAAWFYFNKSIKNLSLGEILTLAVIPQNPLKRSPSKNNIPQELIQARKNLYNTWIGKRPEDAILNVEIDLPPLLVCRYPRRTLHFTEYLNTLPFPAANQYRTTIDAYYQDICERELASFLTRSRNWGIKNGSILLLDYTTMEVLAAVGSADYFNDGIQGKVNGITAKRSPGSTLKPFIYALAIEQGLIHPEKMLKDTPMGFSEYTPDNFKGEFKGPVKAWYALVDSRNIPAVNLARDIHNPDLYGFLKKAGISPLKERDHYGLSLVLGSADISMMELAGLYACLANEGIKREPRFLAGGIGEKESGKQVRMLSAEAAAITLKMLERNIPPDNFQTGNNRPVPVAYKTGTSIGFKDSWSIAIFDRFVLAVWLGNFSGEGNNTLIGRLTAAPLQFYITDAVLAALPRERLFPPRPLPPGIETIEVCAVSGDIPGEDCPQTIKTWFIPGVSPINRCRIHRLIHIDTRTGYRTNETSGPYIRSEVREFWPTDLLEIFAQAGLPRVLPPPYPPHIDASAGSQLSALPSVRQDQSLIVPPVIISPLSNTTYILQDNASNYNQIVLLASADQDSDELFWFANAIFLGRAKPNERLLWTPQSGRWDLAVVDSRGMSASIRVKVEKMK